MQVLARWPNVMSLDLSGTGIRTLQSCPALSHLRHLSLASNALTTLRVRRRGGAVVSSVDTSPLARSSRELMTCSPTILVVVYGAVLPISVVISKTCDICTGNRTTRLHYVFGCRAQQPCAAWFHLTAVKPHPPPVCASSSEMQT